MSEEAPKDNEGHAPTPKKRSSKKKRATPSVQHTSLVLDIDVERSILFGYAELHMRVKSKQPVTSVRLHARQLAIHRVRVDGLDAQFDYVDPLLQPCDPQGPIRSLSTFNVTYKALLDDADKGGLNVHIPSSLQSDLGKRDKFLVRVDYVLDHPTAGIHFASVRPSMATIDEDYGLSASEVLPPAHMYSHNEVNSARCWLPCLDRFSQPCTWSFQYRVPSPYMVVSTGELVHVEHEEVDHPEDGPRTLTTYHYEEQQPTTVKNIAVTAGIFEVYPDAVLPSVTYFCLPGHLPQLKHTTRFLHKAYQFYERYLEMPFPYSSFKVVFVDHGYTKMGSFANMAIMGGHLLHDETIIDKTLKARWLLMLAVAIQWFGNYVTLRSWSDIWLRFGLSTHLANLYYREMFGNNEARLRHYKTFMEVAELDEDRPPLHWLLPLHPIQYYQPLIIKKASIIIGMIERRLTPAVFQKQIMIASVKPGGEGNEFKDLKLSTRNFLKQFKNNAPEQEVRQFEKQWITGRGCPRMQTGFTYNKKKHRTEFVLKQLLPPKERFSGTLVVCINELHGIYDDNFIEFMGEYHEENFSCDSRLRKNHKKIFQYVNGDEIEISISDLEFPLLWIRVDPHCNWGPNVKFGQLEHMWIYQLEMDRDVMAQYQAIEALASIPTPTGADALVRVLAETRYFYRIRMDAALALTTMTNRVADCAGSQRLLLYFKAHYYDARLEMVRPNDFSDMPQYHVKKALVEAISRMRDQEGYTPSEVFEFLLDLLKNNENSENAFSDYKYVATVIESLANVNLSITRKYISIDKQILRYLKVEKLMPSYQRTVTAACLKCLASLQHARKLSRDLFLFKEFCRYAHHESVRAAAYRGIVLLACGTEDESMEVVWDLLRDPMESPRLKYKVLAYWAQIFDTGRLARADLQQPRPANERLCDALWEFLNSELTAYDSRLRWSTLTLYRSIWGYERPACLPPLPEPKPVFVEEPSKRKTKSSGATIRISADLLSQANNQQHQKADSRRSSSSATLRATQGMRPVKLESRSNSQMEVDSPPATASSLDGQDPRPPISPKKEAPPVKQATPTPTPVPPPPVATRVEESSEEKTPLITVKMEENGGHSLASVRDLPKPVKRKGRDFEASFSDTGILHIDINNPEKRQKLEEQARAELAAPPKTAKSRRASTTTPRLPALPASLRNKTLSAVLSPPNVVTITISPSTK